MKRSTVRHLQQFALFLCLCALLNSGCDTKSGSRETPSNAPALAGTWLLKSRIVEGAETPVTERCMKLTFSPDGSFRASYRGNDTQNWVRAGQGGFAYHPPYLSLHWESGPVLTLLVREADPERLFIHHGRNMIPLKDQEPGEIFIKQKIEKGPTRG